MVAQLKNVYIGVKLSVPRYLFSLCKNEKIALLSGHSYIQSPKNSIKQGTTTPSPCFVHFLAWKNPHKPKRHKWSQKYTSSLICS